jgi:hypothetical protein
VDAVQVLTQRTLVHFDRTVAALVAENLSLAHFDSPFSLRPFRLECRYRSTHTLPWLAMAKQRRCGCPNRRVRVTQASMSGLF